MIMHELAVLAAALGHEFAPRLWGCSCVRYQKTIEQPGRWLHSGCFVTLGMNIMQCACRLFCNPGGLCRAGMLQAWLLRCFATWGPTKVGVLWGSTIVSQRASLADQHTVGMPRVWACCNSFTVTP